MTTNKTTAKEVAPKETTPKVESKEFNGETVSDTPVGLAEGDETYKYSQAVDTHDLSPNQEMDDSKESKEVIKDDEKVKEAVNSGDVAGLTAAQLSVLQKPMVADPISKKPVYETAEQYHLAMAAAGKLSTPSE